MAEIVTSAFSRYSNPLIDDLRSMSAWLWDTGPTEPDYPEPPQMPEGKEGDPKYDLAKIQFKRALRAYEEALLDYERRLAEYKDFKRRYGGPIEVKFWSVDAMDAIKYDLLAVFEGRQAKPRWYVSKRTTTMLQNRILGAMRDTLEREKVELDVRLGLPKGMKPGAGHQAALERQIAGEAEFTAALRADPQFGQEMA
jgi:hypothetical protein